jgi:hypothetical protein
MTISFLAVVLSRKIAAGAVAAVVAGSEMLAAAGGVRYSPVINLGAAIIAILLGLLTLAGVIWAARRRSDVDGLKAAVEAAVSASASWEREYNAEKIGRERAETEAKEQRELKHAALNEVAALRLKTDVTMVLKQMQADQATLLTALAGNQEAGLAAAAQLLAGTEERILGQMAKLTTAQSELVTSQVELTNLVGRVVERVEKLETNGA